MLVYIFKAFLLTSLVGTALTLLLTAIKPIRCILKNVKHFIWKQSRNTVRKNFKSL